MSNILSRIEQSFVEQDKAISSLQRDLDELSDEIIKTKNSIRNIKASHLSADEVSTRLDQFLSYHEHRCRLSFIPSAAAITQNGADGMRVAELLSTPATALGMLTILLGADVIKAKLTAEIDGEIGKAPRLNSEEREGKLKKLTEHLAHLEMVRERLIRGAEAASGSQIDRDTEADISALLAKL